MYKCSGFQASPRKGLNRNIFSQKCRLIPTDKGMISLEELFEETKNLRVIGSSLSFIRGSVGNYLNCKSTERELLDEYIYPEETVRYANSYISITADMFRHVRSTFFENPDEPAADEFVRTVLEEERIDAGSLFEILQGKPWYKSFLTRGILPPRYWTIISGSCPR